jgi:hypothetical protein
MRVKEEEEEEEEPCWAWPFPTACPQQQPDLMPPAPLFCLSRIDGCLLLFPHPELVLSCAIPDSSPSELT